MLAGVLYIINHLPITTYVKKLQVYIFTILIYAIYHFTRKHPGYFFIHMEKKISYEPVIGSGWLCKPFPDLLSLTKARPLTPFRSLSSSLLPATPALISYNYNKQQYDSKL